MLKGTEDALAEKLTDKMMATIDLSFIADEGLREEQGRKTREATKKSMYILAGCVIEHFVANTSFVGATSNGGSLEAVKIT